MFDLASYTNGFGVVFVPFVVGVLIRSILSVLHAGSVRGIFYSIIFLVFFFPVFVSAGTFTDTIDSIYLNNSQLSFYSNNDTYFSNNQNIIDVLKKAFQESQDININYDDNTKEVISLTVTQQSDLTSRIYSFFLGGLGCFSFSIGMGLKI